MNSLQVIFSNNPNVIYLPTVKWFQVLLFKINNAIQHYSFVYTELNGYKYYYVKPTIVFNINDLFAST